MNECTHIWRVNYYGYKCVKCDDFVPFGSEPWAPQDDEGDEFPAPANYDANDGTEGSG